MVSRRAEFEERAVARGKDGEAGKIICLKVSLKRGKPRAVADFEKEVIHTYIHTYIHT